MTFTFNPHPWAPLYDDPQNAQLALNQIVDELASGNFPESNENLRQHVRQAGYVNLWFFLKYLAGHAGPYNEINTDLHLDMCNFRQSGSCMEPGSRFAGFMPRSSLKSTILTHGSAQWEALRWPDIRILIINAVEDRAYDFATLCLKTFRDNEMIKWLYPEYIIQHKSAQMVLPNRTRAYPDDTWNYRGYAGALEGTHNNLLLLDDIVGMEDLDSAMMGSMSMEKAKRKFGTATTALLVKSKTDRVGLIGTRYALDDVYEERVKSCREVFGFKDGNIKPKPGGTWDIYYRKWRENGKSIDPETYTEEGMRELLEIDPWSYWTQYENDPREGSTLELYKMKVHRARLENRPDGYWLVRTYNSMAPEELGEVRLDKCYVAVGVDFAGTNTNITARTSKTSIEMFAEDGEGRMYLVEERSDYWDGSELVAELFSLNRKFEGYIHTNILESNAMQKALIPLIRDMARAQDLYFLYEPTPVSSPKDVRIRTIVGTALGGGKVYCVEDTGHEFLSQKDLYPQSAYKKDSLDAGAKAINALRKPWSDEEENELEEEDQAFEERAVGVAGY